MNHGPDRPDRRWAIKKIFRLGLGASAAATGFGKPALSQTPGSIDKERAEKLDAFRKQVDEVKATVKDEVSLSRFRSRLSPLMAISIADSKIQFNWRDVEGSEYDPKKLHKHTALIGFENVIDTNGREKPVFRSLEFGDTPERDRRTLKAAQKGSINYGNVIPVVDTGHFYTAGHVLEKLKPFLDITHIKSRDVDVARGYIPGGYFTLDRLVTETSHLEDRRIHGEWVTIVGIDPDLTATAGKRSKQYGGVAIRATPSMAAFFARGNEAFRKKIENSFCVIIPDGEGEMLPGKDYMPASGMSGSPVFAHLNGAYQFAGIHWGGSSFRLGDKVYSVGFFHGPDAINKANQEFKWAPIIRIEPR